MKILPSITLSLMFLGFWSCSDSGKPLGNDCSETLDCNSVCGGSAVEDECGECGGDGLNADGCCGDETSNCVHYEDEIQPIFTANCTSCHGGSGGLTLTSYSNLMGNDVVNPFDSAASELIQRLKGTSEPQMPQNQDPLGEATINLIEIWIDEGALDN